MVPHTPGNLWTDSRDMMFVASAMFLLRPIPVPWVGLAFVVVWLQLGGKNLH
ncbi:hypothetical protein BO79DRAFT_21414 [Aspergillus costaricaensis CBS 115574]|uniref:Uncharacterized protein n=1 Tax=Aspergillus costaricaensis CBS 115574 TaxID=1448317 RepID=A0ACD1IC31_9EURO|nr:hypothetical protein BO79DRAFT_21414 [Aspergillus costaricaensis CBS 115574]RAK88143.1 hypothetical protein BO79DRAFT_21414 [Aspergillus costaricaensis CBS 115574]